MSEPGATPAVFLDRDGVIVADGLALSDESDLRFIDGAPEAIRRLNRAGYLVVVVSNQSAVARGLITEGAMHGFNSLMVRRLAARETMIGATYCCIHAPDARDPALSHPDHPDRMPRPGMIERAIAERRLDRARSFLIADRPEALEAARTAGLPAFRYEGGGLDGFVRELLGQ